MKSIFYRFTNDKRQMLSIGVDYKFLKPFIRCVYKDTFYNLYIGLGQPLDYLISLHENLKKAIQSKKVWSEKITSKFYPGKEFTIAIKAANKGFVLIFAIEDNIAIAMELTESGINIINEWFNYFTSLAILKDACLLSALTATNRFEKRDNEREILPMKNSNSNNKTEKSKKVNDVLNDDTDFNFDDFNFDDDNNSVEEFNVSDMDEAFKSWKPKK